MIIPDRWLRRLHLFVCDVGHTSDEMLQFEQRGSRIASVTQHNYAHRGNDRAVEISQGTVA